MSRERIAGKCLICSATGNRLVSTKTGTYHSECLRMQRKGLLYTGAPLKVKDSTGQACNGCGEPIDGAHAHRQGKPYHRECLI